MNICNNNLFSRQQQEQDSALINSRRMSIDMVDSSVIKMNNFVNVLKHPGQAVKIQTKLDETDKKDIKINKKNDKVCNVMKQSKSLSNFNEIFDDKMKKPTQTQLKECKSCDENLIKFIFTKHGIKVISDVETIV